jgi:hypothetical protein
MLKFNSGEYNSTGQVLGLFSRGYQFESPLTSGPLKAYMIVNFRARRISQGTCKLARTLTLI